MPFAFAVKGIPFGKVSLKLKRKATASDNTLKNGIYNWWYNVFAIYPNSNRRGLGCNFILLVLDPESKFNSHRLIINLFQDLIKDTNLKDKLLEANSSDEIFNMICEWEENQNKIELWKQF